MDTSDSPDWSMLVVATETITALELRGHTALLCARSTDTLAEIRIRQHPRWRFLVGRCGWSTILLQPEDGDDFLYVAVPGHVDTLDVDAAPTAVAHEIIRQLVDDAPLPGSAPARIDRPRRLPGVSRPQPPTGRQLHGVSTHPAGRRLRTVVAELPDFVTDDAQIIRLQPDSDRD